MLTGHVQCEADSRRRTGITTGSVHEVERETTRESAAQQLAPYERQQT
jgi:hypothetical protein